MNKNLYRVADSDLVPRIEKTFREAKSDAEMEDVSGIYVYNLYEESIVDEAHVAFFIVLSDGVQFYQSVPDGYNWEWVTDD